MGLTKGLSGTYVYNPCLYIDKRQDAVGKPLQFKRGFVDNYYYHKDEIDQIFELSTSLTDIKFDGLYCGPKHLIDVQNLDRYDCKNIAFKPHPGCVATFDEILDLMNFLFSSCLFMSIIFGHFSSINFVFVNFVFFVFKNLKILEISSSEFSINFS